MGLLPPVPYRSSIQDDSNLLPLVWADWFRQAQAKLSDGFASTQAASGSQALPSGLSIKWGVTAALGSATTTAVTFPAPFPTACLQVMAGIRDNSAGSTAETGHFGTGVYLAAGFSIFNRTSAAYAFNWFAVGY